MGCGRDFKQLYIKENGSNQTLAMSKSTKRDKVYDSNDKWIGTKPVVLELKSTEDNMVVVSLTYKILNERTYANDKQKGSFEKENGSNEKENTYTEIVKTTHQNKVSKRIRRRFKPPYFVSKRLRMKLPYIVSKRQRIRRGTKHAFKEVH